MPSRSIPPGVLRKPRLLHAVPAQGWPPSSTAEFPVVGVGASAGGTDAFRQLLAHLPVDSGLAFVLVQHLKASRSRVLCDALARATTMRVVQAVPGIRIEPNRVYVIPAGVQMALEEGLLKVPAHDGDPRHPRTPSTPSFDPSRRSAARSPSAWSSPDLRPTALQPRGGPGQRGHHLRAGSALGPLPRDGPKRDRRGSRRLLFTLASSRIELGRLARHSYLARRAPVPPTPAGAATQARVVALLRTSTGVDFGEHKPGTFHRRLTRRMAVRQVHDVASYLEVLRSDPAEVRFLYDDLLIKVTSFFRDEGSFNELKAIAFPEILKHKAPGTPIRAWVVGCATGEEVYSLAISFLEHLGESAPAHPVLIFGSDLSETAIQTARAGVYPDTAVNGLGEARLKRFFTRTDRGWRVKQAVRELCVFVSHDVARAPPFSRLDVVSCRNVLIYFGRPLQRRVLAVAHYCLNQPGYLLLGRSESASGAANWFTPVKNGGRLLARKPGPSIYHLAARTAALPSFDSPLAADGPVPRPTACGRATPTSWCWRGTDRPASWSTIAWR